MKILTLGIVLLLAGCTTTRAINIPVVVPCVHPQLPKKPHLPIYDLNTGSNPAEVIKAYVASVETLNFFLDSIYAEYAAPGAV
jgi:hypothetical protein